MVGTVVCIITCVVILPISYGITFLIIGVLELCEYIDWILFQSHPRIIFNLFFFSGYDLLLAGCIQLLPTITGKRADEYKFTSRNETSHFTYVIRPYYYAIKVPSRIKPKSTISPLKWPS